MGINEAKVKIDKASANKSFVQLGHGVEAIIGSTYPSFGFGGRNSTGH